MVYADGVTVEHKNGFAGHFFGSDGEVQVDRGRFSLALNGKEVAKFTRREDGGSLTSTLYKVKKQYLADAKINLYKSEHHIQDFLKSVATRKKPITSEIVGGRTAICCHLMNLTYYHGEKIKWDPAGNRFTDGTGSVVWLTRDYRSPWNV